MKYLLSGIHCSFLNIPNRFLFTFFFWVTILVVFFRLLFTTFSIKLKNPRVSVVKKNCSMFSAFKHIVDLNSRRAPADLSTKRAFMPTTNLLSERVMATGTSTFLLSVYTGKRARVWMILDLQLLFLSVFFVSCTTFYVIHRGLRARAPARVCVSIAETPHTLFVVGRWRSVGINCYETQFFFFSVFAIRPFNIHVYVIVSFVVVVHSTSRIAQSLRTGSPQTYIAFYGYCRFYNLT